MLEMKKHWNELKERLKKTMNIKQRNEWRNKKGCLGKQRHEATKGLRKEETKVVGGFVFKLFWCYFVSLTLVAISFSRYIFCSLLLKEFGEKMNQQEGLVPMSL